MYDNTFTCTPVMFTHPLLKEHLSSGGQAHAPFRSLKVLDPHFFFETLNLLAQRWLSHM
jgi:hypothetical protein